MSRSPSRATLVATLLTAALAAGAGSAGAQAQPASTDALDLTLPVLDLDLETSSLDGSVARVDGVDTVRVTLDADVLFAFDRARLTRRAASRLKQVAAEIERSDTAAVAIVGHSDSKGAAVYNERLSRRRADAVRRALARMLGSGAPRLDARGRGESDPVAQNTKADGKDDPAGRARNRRVEIRIPK